MTLSTLVLALSLTGFVAVGDTAALQRADTLAKSVAVAGLEQAEAIYIAALQKDPNNVDLLVKASITITDNIAHKTNGATATVHGAQDSGEFRDIWRTRGQQASDLADKAFALEPKNTRVIAQRAATFGYLSASYGIVTAITRGAGTEFKTRTQALIDADPAYDDALGFYLVGLLNILAPWPVGSSSDAADYLTLALSTAPKSVRNNYAMGVHLAKDKGAAKKYFQAAIDLPCSTTTSERMFCDFLKAESRKNIAAQ